MKRRIFTRTVFFELKTIALFFKFKNRKPIQYFSLLLLTLVSLEVCAQNLIVNPGAELPPVGNGWQQVSGNWVQRTTNPLPFEGTAYFFAGANSQAELYQDVDVSSFASSIDSGLTMFTFTGYVRSYSQTPSDQSQEIVEYRNEGGDTLSTFTSAMYNDSSQWTQITDTRLAPKLTRTIRIRLLAKRNEGDNNDGYHDSLSLTISRVLPIKLVFFKIKNSGHIQNLTWQTSQEINTAFFYIQRSTDGVRFATIGRVEALGSSNSLNNYTYSDDISNLKCNVVYYRLQQVDLDGKSTYSNVVTTQIMNSRFSVIPNPAKDIVRVIGKDIQRIRVVDSEGRICIQTQTLGNDKIDISKLSKGVYFILVTDTNGYTEKKRILVQ